MGLRRLPGEDVEKRMSTLTQTIFLEGRKSISIVCQNCGRFKHFEADHLRTHGGKTVAVKCACGANFQVFLERRDRYRKPMSIPGWYCLNQQDSIKRPMILVNLSHSGLGFDVQRRDKIAVGDLLRIDFNLGDIGIHCKVVVRNIDKFRIGAEFVNLDPRSREVIGFTLMV
jgi:hypothetical protein